MKNIKGITLAVLIGFSSASWAETQDHYDIRLNGTLILRYIHGFDSTDKDSFFETYKPYLRVHNKIGEPITKDTGPLYKHHRGLFVGWANIRFDGVAYDFWHMKDGAHQVHQRFIEKDDTSFTSLVHWNTGGDNPITIIEEERRIECRPLPDPAYAMIDLKTTLTASVSDISLSGSPEHSGIQYRPAGEIELEQTEFFFPREFEPGQLDMPWVGETYVLHGKDYTVVMLNHPNNPEGSRLSAYRDYGRFGYAPAKKLKQGESAVFQYRFLLAEGRVHDSALFQGYYNEFAKTNAAIPELFVKKAKGKVIKKK